MDSASETSPKALSEAGTEAVPEPANAEAGSAEVAAEVPSDQGAERSSEVDLPKKLRQRRHLQWGFGHKRPPQETQP